MKKTLGKIVFFGSGPVAAASLQNLAGHFEIEAVVTKPSVAQDMVNLPGLAKDTCIYTVKDRQELDKLIDDDLFKTSLGVIVDFGVIVSLKVIDYFELGIINSHFSLLPRWRGADPITFAILNGDTKTGVSLMLIDETLDTGKILVQKSMKIAPDETTPSLTTRLIKLSSELLVEYIPHYMAGQVKPRSQPHPDRATYSRKLTKADGLIDWRKPAKQIEREIRAYAGWPNSRAELAGKEVIVTKASVIDKKGRPGAVSTNDKTLVVYCSHDALVIEMLKPAGKSEMTAQAFLAGYKQFLNH